MDLTFRGPQERGAWPAGTEVVPIRVEYGQVFVEATLRSPSGRTVSGVLVLDTGAPTLAIGARAWNQLQLDTLVMEGSFLKLIRRSLISVELGATRIPELAIGGLVADSLLEPGVLGLLGPSLIQDRALVLDYAKSECAIVPPRLAVVATDSTTFGAANVTREARIRRSRASYSAALGADAIAVPFRLFEGGRILVNARAAEPDQAWRGQVLSLLVDTGASACVLFEDILAERVGHARGWPSLRDVPMRTMLGTTLVNATVVPSLQLEEASRPLAVPRLDVAVADRRSLPEIEGTLPERVHGLLGYTFLRHFRVALDYGNQVLWLQPLESGAERALRRPHVGLRLERRWGGIRVASVAKGSSAEQADIVGGDVVVSIGGAALLDREVEAVEAMLEGDQDSEVLIVTRHETWESVHRLKRSSRP